MANIEFTLDKVKDYLLPKLTMLGDQKNGPRFFTKDHIALLKLRDSIQNSNSLSEVLNHLEARFNKPGSGYFQGSPNTALYYVLSEAFSDASSPIGCSQKIALEFVAQLRNRIADDLESVQQPPSPDRR